MRLVFEVAHWRLVVDLSPDCVEEDVFEEDLDGLSGGRLDAHLAFGFAPDPVFPELDWGEEDADVDSQGGRQGVSDPFP